MNLLIIVLHITQTIELFGPPAVFDELQINAYGLGHCDPDDDFEANTNAQDYCARFDGDWYLFETYSFFRNWLEDEADAFESSHCNNSGHSNYVDTVHMRHYEFDPICMFFDDYDGTNHDEHHVSLLSVLIGWL